MTNMDAGKGPLDYLAEALIARGRTWGDQNAERLQKDNLYAKVMWSPAFKRHGTMPVGTASIRNNTAWWVGDTARGSVARNV